MTQQNKRPEWAPEACGDEFAGRMLPGVRAVHDGMSLPAAPPTGRMPAKTRTRLTLDQYEKGVLACDRAVLGQAITLVESNARAHMEAAQALLKRLLPKTGNSIRVGISGVPGVGKSTFIEVFGNHVLDLGKRLAVLAIDPSSSLTRGSILGDKTRMETISRHPDCFIRPSPSGGTLGGVARKTRETMLVCEAAGFDVIFVETVGVGQSEVTVRSMVDFFLLLMLPGGGDELQGIKRGIMEIADALLINKADGDNKVRAKVAKNEYQRAVHYLQPPTAGWDVRVNTCSSVTGDGVGDVWELIREFQKITTGSGAFEKRRKSQQLGWLHDMVAEHLQTRFFTNPQVRSALPGIEKQVAEGILPTTAAVGRLVEIYEGGKAKQKG